MLKIYVCEDNLPERQRIIDIITKVICIEEYDMELALASDDPHKLLEFLRQTPSTAVYFIDIVLHYDMDVIAHSSEIRKLDPRGFIVFMTNHINAWKLTFQYKLEVMDFIMKNDVQKLAESIADCLKKANELYTAQTNTAHKLFRFKVGSQLVTLPMDTVLYFETSPSSHRIIAHTMTQTTEFYSSIKSLTEQADCHFLQSHRRCLVNTQHITSVDFARLEIHMTNGDTCPVSSRHLKYFKQ